MLMLFGSDQQFTPASLLTSTNSGWWRPESGCYKDTSVAFNGTNQSMTTASATGLTNSGFLYAWVTPTTTPAGNTRLFGTGTGANYMSLRCFGFTPSLISGGGALPNIASSVDMNVGLPNLLIASYDNTDGMKFYLNGVLTGSLAGPITITAPTTNIAMAVFVDFASQFFTGYIGPCGIGTALPTLADVAELYNGGISKTYSQLSAGLQAKFLSYYDNTTTAGTDAKGVNNLTPNNTPLAGPGNFANSLCVDGDPISCWVASNGALWNAASLAARPTWRANSGNPYVDTDNVNDGMRSRVALIGAQTLAFGVRQLSAVSNGNRVLQATTNNCLMGPRRTDLNMFVNGGCVQSPTDYSGFQAMIASKASGGAWDTLMSGVDINGTSVNTTNWSANATDFVCMGGAGAFPAEYVNGYIRDIILTNRELTAAEKVSTNTYLLSRAV